MIADYGSDPAAKDISRVLRVPGFQHRKNPAEPHMVAVVGGDGRRYTRAEILAAFPPVEKTSPRGNGHEGDGYSEGHAELVRQVLTGETYHAALTSLAWRLIGAGMPGGQVVDTCGAPCLLLPKRGGMSGGKRVLMRYRGLSALPKRSAPKSRNRNQARK